MDLTSSTYDPALRSSPEPRQRQEALRSERLACVPPNPAVVLDDYKIVIVDPDSDQNLPQRYSRGLRDQPDDRADVEGKSGFGALPSLRSVLAKVC
jgi:hypothetical protein